MLRTFTGAQAHADQPDETLPFFASGQAYDSHGIDTLNLFNGDVNLRIPLGPAYALGPTGFQFQLQAASSVKFWHFSTSTCGGLNTRFAWIAGDPTVGVGWAVQMGYVVKRAVNSKWEYYSPDGSVHDTRLTTSLSQAVTVDGTHLRTTAIPNTTSPTSFTIELPDGTLETFNHQYAEPQPSAGSSVDFSNLDFGEAPQNRFGLATIKDRFGNTLVTVNWSGTNPSEIASITLNPFNSNVTFNWTSYTVSGVTWRVLDNLLFPAPASKQLKTQFAYSPGTFVRNTFDTSAGASGCPASGANVAVPQLASVTMSDPGSSSIVSFGYGFTYFTAPSGNIQKQGTLLKATLPSLGTVQFDYDITVGAACTISPTCDPNGAGPVEGTVPDPTVREDPPFWDHSPGAISRTEFDPFTNRSAVTTYARKNFKGALSNGLPDNSEAFRRTTVIAPGNDEGGSSQYARRYYFHVDNTDGSQVNASGIELDRRFYASNDPTQPAVRTFISCYVGQCGYQAGDGSIYKYTMPSTPNGGRLPAEAYAVWYGATPGGQDGRICTTTYTTKCTKTDNTNYNATAGRYDDVTVTTTLPGTVNRTVETNWTPSTAASHWILDLFDHQFTWDGASLPVGVSDGQTVVRQYFNYDSTGFLKGSWTWDSVVDKVIMNCNYNAGNGTISGNFSQTYTSASEPTTSNCPGAMPSISADSDTFGKDHTWTNLLLTRSAWRSGSGSIGWNSFDVLRDTSTGAITEARDQNYAINTTLKTAYTYDALGRVLMVQPPGGSAVEWPTTFCYLPGTNGYTPEVIVKKTTASPILNPNDTNGICKRDEGTPSTTSGLIEGYIYDGFGRLIREIKRGNRKFAGATYFSRRETRYDSAGHRRILSDWLACPHDGTGQFADTSISACALPKVVVPANDFPGHNLWSLNFDPFGRPQNFGNVDQATIATDFFVDRTDDRFSPSIQFSDSKEKVTNLCVNGIWSTSTCTGTGAKDVQMTIERDALGRSTKVTEPDPASGNLSATDKTTYGFNVLNYISSVSEAASGSSQTRTLQYLAFGFLKSETHPETGVSGNATTTYSLYGSLGNLRTKTDGSPSSTQYNYTYDPAGRLTLLTTGTGAPVTKYLVYCFDGTGACGDTSVSNFFGGLYPKGRLTRRVGWNQMGFPAAPVYDDFTYSSGANRISAQTTSIGQRGTDLTKNGFGLPVTQTWSYNLQGVINTHSHPRGSGAPTTLTVNDSEVTSGLLTKVTASWGGGSQQIVTANYHQSGRLTDYTTGSATPNVKTTIADDAVIPSRPAGFTVTKSAGGTLFQTGSYTYDGAGNIKNIGSDAFTYDARSRLTQAVYAGTGGGTQGFTYDRYGNLMSKTGVNPVTLTTTATTNHLSGSTYDDRGNLTLFPTVAPQENLFYDSLNRQYRSIDNVLGTDFTYIYDGGGERVGKFPSDGGATRREFARIIIEGRGDSPLSCTNPGPFGDVSCAANPNDGKYVQEMKDIGITSGCGGGNYCPDVQTPRDQSAVFFLKGEHCALNTTGCTYTPPPCSTTHVFADVTCPSQYADWVGELYVEGITVGCGGNDFCPSQPLGTWQMLAWAQKIWPTYDPLPRSTILTYRDDSAQIATEAQSVSLTGDSSATLTYSKDNVFLGPLLVASATWSGTTPGWNFYSSDHLGTPRVTTDVGASAALETRKYWPYGDDGPMTGVDTMQRIRFDAMERDTEAKHYFDHARYHDFNIGRFTTPEHSGGQAEDPLTFNRYAFAHDNPMLFVDRDGRNGLAWLAGGVIVGTAVIEGTSKAWDYYQAGKSPAEGFRIGAESGAAGALVAVVLAAAGARNPYVLGAAGGLTSSIVESELETGHMPDFWEAFGDTVLSALFAKGGDLVLPAGPGRPPSYWVGRAFRSMFSKLKPNVRKTLLRDLAVALAQAATGGAEHIKDSFTTAVNVFGEGYLNFMFNLNAGTPSGKVTTCADSGGCTTVEVGDKKDEGKE